MLEFNITSVAELNGFESEFVGRNEKKDLNTWIVIYAHKLFVSHLLLILSRPDEDRKKIPRLVKMKKMPIVLCAKK